MYKEDYFHIEISCQTPQKKQIRKEHGTRSAICLEMNSNFEKSIQQHTFESPNFDNMQKINFSRIFRAEYLLKRSSCCSRKNKQFNAILNKKKTIERLFYIRWDKSIIEALQN